MVDAAHGVVIVVCFCCCGCGEYGCGCAAVPAAGAPAGVLAAGAAITARRTRQRVGPSPALFADFVARWSDRKRVTALRYCCWCVPHGGACHSALGLSVTVGSGALYHLGSGSETIKLIAK